jgi:hypothetical protein
MRRPMLVCAALAAALPACNQLYGVEATVLVDAAPDADLRPDRDHDGVADVEDPCIAAAQDSADDIDEDGIPNESDSCPFAVAAGDKDGDGVGDGCDPFPDVAGDRRLCTMRFLDAELNASLWKAREGEAEWAFASGYLVGLEQPPLVASMVAQERITPTDGTTLIEIGVTALSQTLSSPASTFGVWLSAGPTPSDSDVSCEVHSDPSGINITVVGATAGPKAAGPAASVKGGLLRVIFQPGKAGINLACVLAYDGTVAAASGHFDGELGQQGFNVRNTAIAIRGLAIYHRDDQPDVD